MRRFVVSVRFPVVGMTVDAENPDGAYNLVADMICRNDMRLRDEFEGASALCEITEVEEVVNEDLITVWRK